jgi:hypothetical protein
VVFATITAIGGILFLSGSLLFMRGGFGPYDPNPMPAVQAFLSLFGGMGLLAFGGLGLLAGTQSASERRIRYDREDTLRRQGDLANAQNLETAGRFEEAALAYERLGMLADAGRARSSKRTIRINGTVGTGQTSVIREKETIVKEVVMIPCKYCGGLMNQTSESCPNCGARSRA